MGSRKQGISDETDSISDENDDQQEEVKSENNAGGGATAGKRSYECTFCKRGFTNAQALGGHMNIHRKDRAKAKQLTTGSSSSSITIKPNTNPNFPGRVSSGQTVDYYPVTVTRSYFQQQQVSDGNNGNGLMDFQGKFRSNEQIWGENLSLRVGSNHDLEDKSGDVLEEDELDLELRLGHDRYRLS